MLVTVDSKTDFVNSFLTPISKIATSAVIVGENKTFSSILATSDNTILVNLHYTNKSEIEKCVLNIPDVPKLIRVLSVLDLSGDTINFDVSSNNISFKSETSRFKFHLFEDGIIQTPKVTFDKLNSLDFDGTFTINYTSLISLIKGSTIATDSNKVYLTFDKNFVYCDLTDKSRPNVDSYGLRVTDDYKGPQIAIPTALNFETFRILSSMKFKDLTCKFCSNKGIFLLEAKPNNCIIKFVISALAN